MRIIITSINPEPWAIGTIHAWGKGRADMAPNPKLVTYKAALREELENMGYTEPDQGDGWPIHVKFYFFRSTERGNVADTTNLVKSTEDACQGILFGNDRFNRHVEGEIMEQGPDVEDVGIIIDIEPYDFDPDRHEELCALMRVPKAPAFSNTDYTDPGDVF